MSRSEPRQKLAPGVAILLILSFLFVASSVTAEVFKFRDEEGVLHLTNKRTQQRFQGPRITTFRSTPKPPATPYDKNEIIKIIDKVSTSEGVDPALVRAVARAESGFNPNAISPKGACGVMQLIPETAERFKVKDIFHAEQNINGGVKYLKYLLDLFSKDVRLAVAAYNAGENAVLNAGGIPDYKETINYVDTVVSYYNGSGERLNEPGKRISRPVRFRLDSSGNLILTNL